MPAKLEQLLHKLHLDREQLKPENPQEDSEWHQAESLWSKLQDRLQSAGVVWGDKVGSLLEHVEDEVVEITEKASTATWKLNFKAHDQLHGLGESMDSLEHTLQDKTQVIRQEVIDELHEVGDEINKLYHKIKSGIKH